MVIITINHDMTIAAILSALGIFDGKYPRYAASLRFELHKAKNEECEAVGSLGGGGGVDPVLGPPGGECWSVRILYNSDDITSSFCTGASRRTNLSRGGDRSGCPYGNFAAQLRKLVVADFDSLCAGRGGANSATPLSAIMSFVGVGTLLCLAGFLLLRCFISIGPSPPTFLIW